MLLVLGVPDVNHKEWPQQWLFRQRHIKRRDLAESRIQGGYVIVFFYGERLSMHLQLVVRNHLLVITSVRQVHADLWLDRFLRQVTNRVHRDAELVAGC